MTRALIKYFSCLVLVLVLAAPAWPGDKTLTLAATEWPPYTSEAMPGQGFLCEIGARAMKQMGYRVEYVFVPWSRAMKMVEAGAVDGIIGISYTREREEIVIFPCYAWNEPFMFLALPGTAITFKRLSDLCPGRVAMLRGGVFKDMLLKSGCLEVVEVDNDDESLRLMVKGEVEYASMYLGAARHLLCNMGLALGQSVFKVSPAIDQDDIHLAFSRQRKGHKKLVEDYGRGMHSLIESGDLDRILKKHNVAANRFRKYEIRN